MVVTVPGMLNRQTLRWRNRQFESFPCLKRSVHKDEVRLSETLTISRSLHSMNGFLQKGVTGLGILIEDNLQDENALLPMITTEFGSSININWEQKRTHFLQWRWLWSESGQTSVSYTLRTCGQWWTQRHPSAILTVLSTASSLVRELSTQPVRPMGLSNLSSSQLSKGDLLPLDSIWKQGHSCQDFEWLRFSFNMYRSKKRIRKEQKKPMRMLHLKDMSIIRHTKILSESTYDLPSEEHMYNIKYTNATK